MTAGDLPSVLAWRNSDHVRQFMYTKHEISADEHQAWFNRRTMDPDWYLLIFEDRGVPSGYVSFHRKSGQEAAEWGFYTAPSAEKGTGQRLGIAALDCGLGTMNFAKICGEALASNASSVKFHEKMGFQCEKLLVGAHFDGSSHCDVLCFEISAAEWQEARARLLK